MYMIALYKKEDTKMALVKCEECQTEISDKAKTCPNCGCPIEKNNKKTCKSNILAGIMLLFGIPLGGFGLAICLFGIIWSILEMLDKNIKGKGWAVTALIVYIMDSIIVIATLR